MVSAFVRAAPRAVTAKRSNFASGSAYVIGRAAWPTTDGSVSASTIPSSSITASVANRPGRDPKRQTPAHETARIALVPDE